MYKTLLAVLAILCLSLSSRAQKVMLLTGTYTGPGKGEGIYVYDFDLATGNAVLKSTARDIINPSYLTVSANKRNIYSVNEDGAKSAASAFSFNPGTGAIKLLNRAGMAGKDPCYIINDNNNVITANYSSGSITVYAREKDGRLGRTKQVIQHYGHGADPKKQASAHAHMVFFSPDKKYILANDLGTDQVYIYKYNSAAASPLTISDSIKVAPGAGPRHLAFAPSGNMAYLISEFDGNIYSYSYANGKLTFRNKTAALKTDKAPDNWDAADIHLSPDGKFLYVSLRGNLNSISVFAVAGEKLTFVQHIGTKGITPRNFAISPDGNWLLAAHQRSNNITIFKRNKADGTLSDSGKQISVGAPVCLVFL